MDPSPPVADNDDDDDDDVVVGCGRDGPPNCGGICKLGTTGCWGIKTPDDPAWEGSSCPELDGGEEADTLETAAGSVFASSRGVG